MMAAGSPMVAGGGFEPPTSGATPVAGCVSEAGGPVIV